MKKMFSDFPGITTDAWEEKIKADLRDSEAIEKLTWFSEEGIRVKPFYRTEDIGKLKYLQYLHLLKKQGPVPNSWTVCQDLFSGEDPVRTQLKINHALNGGARAIRFRFSGHEDPDFSRLDTLLKEISLKETEVMFQGTMRADVIYSNLVQLAQKQGVSPEMLSGSLGADPIGFMVSTGIPIASLENLNRLVSGVAGIYPGLRVIDVSGAAIQDAGSTLVEELAFTLAMASEYMAELTARGIDPRHIQDAMQLSISSGPNFFMEIAKLRAARVLWSSIAVAYGIDPSNTGITIHATSSSWNLTLYDPYINLLRGTSEAISAILGGADYLTVLPYDYPLGESSSFSDRIARNIQIIMREESYLDRVSDPASGSYYIETLTDSIGGKAWDLFREVESMGGFRKAFESGWIQQQVYRSRKRKLERFSSGEFKLVGTNAYPNFNEAIEEYFIKSEKEIEQDSQVQPLVPFRPSSMFEKVRYATEKSGKRPKVFLFKHGNHSWASARANFSGNFFACAGYEILESPQFNLIEDGIDAARDAKAEIVVLCSSDDVYEIIAPEVCSALKDQSLLVVAGLPVKSNEKLKAAGISHFIHQKCNLLETLQEFNSILL